MMHPRAYRSSTIAAALSLVMALAAAAQPDTPAKRAIDLTGKWTFTTQSSYGTSTPAVSFTQKGDSLKGQYQSATLGNRDFTGTIKDGKFSFGFDAEMGGQAFSMSFTGKVEDDGS